jgi:hypothetical protein
MGITCLRRHKDSRIDNSPKLENINTKPKRTENKAKPVETKIPVPSKGTKSITKKLTQTK